jgi:ABC-type sugar transport system ATPase subunit
MGVRPEDILLADAPESVTITATADVIEPLGKERLLYFDIGDQSYKASVEGTEEFSEGSEIPLQFPTDLLHLFDSDTGDAVLSPSIRKGVVTTEEVSTSP